MTASVIGALRVNLGLDSAQFSRGLTQAQKSAAAAGRQFLGFAGVATAAMAAVSAKALAGARDIDVLAKGARRIGSSVEGLQALQLAAGEMGVSIDSLTENVQTMNREIQKGSAGAVTALEDLRLSASDLSGLDADKKMAIIADRVRDLGLNADEASVVMQGLGIRSREMVLAVMSGGDAFRDARRDVADYGISISEIDAAAIEAANDKIGRLGLISQYAGQQLAIALVPAMGDLAQTMTDSLREGGLLRTVIDGLIASLPALATGVTVVGTALATRYIGLAVSAKVATLLLSGSFSATAVAAGVLRGALVALGGPLGVVYGLIGAGAAAWLAFGRDTDTATGAMNDAEEAASRLGTELGILSGNDLPIATAKTVDLANANLTLARSALEAAKAQVALRQANLQAGFDQMSMENAFLPGVENPGTAIFTQRMAEARAAADEYNKAQAELNARVLEGEKVKNDASQVVRDLTVNVRGLGSAASGGAGGGAAGGMRKATEEAKNLAEQMDGPLPTAIDGVAQAFGDFIARGLTDFKGFAQSILKSFQSMLAQMIATAARNRILLSIGAGGSVAGTAANAAGSMMGGAGGIAGTIASLGTFASSIGTGLAGVMGGGGIAAGVSGGLAAGGAAGMGMALGAALPILAPLAIGAFLFNRRRKRRERRRAAEQAEQQRLAEEQEKQALIDNQAFGMDTQILELQGFKTEALTRTRQKELEAIDASLRPRAELIYSLRDQAEIDEERFYIQNRLLELQGKEAEVEARNRDKVLKATNDANRALRQQVFDLEDMEQAARSASERIREFSQQSSNFATRQDQEFAATASGFTAKGLQVENVALLQKLISEVVRGNMNNARLTSQLVAIQQREALGARG